MEHLQVQDSVAEIDIFIGEVSGSVRDSAFRAEPLTISDYRVSIFPVEQPSEFSLFHNGHKTEPLMSVDAYFIRFYLSDLPSIQDAGGVDVAVDQNTATITFRDPGAQLLISGSSPRISTIRLVEGDASTQEVQVIDFCAALTAATLSTRTLEKTTSIEFNSLSAASHQVEVLTVRGDGMTGWFALQDTQTGRITQFLTPRATAAQVEAALNAIVPDGFFVWTEWTGELHIQRQVPGNFAPLALLDQKLRMPSGLRASLNMTAVMLDRSGGFYLSVKKTGDVDEVIIHEPFSFSLTTDDITATATPTPGDGMTYTQAAPATVWTINHNFGYYPDIICYDTTGQRIHGSVQNLSTNTIQVTFTAAIAGSARIT